MRPPKGMVVLTLTFTLVTTEVTSQTGYHGMADQYTPGNWLCVNCFSRGF